MGRTGGGEREEGGRTEGEGERRAADHVNDSRWSDEGGGREGGQGEGPGVAKAAWLTLFEGGSRLVLCWLVWMFFMHFVYCRVFFFAFW